MERVFYDEATQFFIFFPIYLSFFLSASYALFYYDFDYV